MNPKRQAPSAPRSEKSIDKICSLPDDVISRILSLIPTKFATRTSILSKRWEFLWTSVTNLDFDHPQKHSYRPPPLTTFIDFVNRVLSLCKSSKIHLFRLSCHNPKDADLPVDNWIEEAIRLHVNEIVIKVPNLKVPVSLFTCETLTTLKLESFCSEIPSTARFPNLKILEISVVSEEMLERLPFVCPMLEDLCVYGEITNQTKFVVRIATSTVKRLRVGPSSYVDQRTELVFSTPNLEFVHVSNAMKLRFEKLDSLAEASLELSYYGTEEEYEDEHFGCFWDWQQKRDHVIELFRQIIGVKSLELCFHAENLPVLEFLHDTKLPIFHHLTSLQMVFRNFNSCKYLPLFLESSPNLKSLSLEKAFWFDNFVVRLQFPSACSLLHLLEIKLEGFEGKKEEDLPILEYLQKSAKSLKLLKVICKRLTIEKERESYNKFLELWKSAKIEFCGARFRPYP